MFLSEVIFETYFKGKDYVIDDEAAVKYEDADTYIEDVQGYRHYGYTCNCTACPYIVRDEDGEWACYGKMYMECKSE